jgi:hypothetical protein
LKLSRLLKKPSHFITPHPSNNISNKKYPRTSTHYLSPLFLLTLNPPLHLRSTLPFPQLNSALPHFIPFLFFRKKKNKKPIKKKLIINSYQVKFVIPFTIYLYFKKKKIKFYNSFIFTLKY